jgi:hypothetical protein
MLLDFSIICIKNVRRKPFLFGGTKNEITNVKRKQICDYAARKANVNRQLLIPVAAYNKAANEVPAGTGVCELRLNSPTLNNCIPAL